MDLVFKVTHNSYTGICIHSGEWNQQNLFWYEMVKLKSVKHNIRKVLHILYIFIANRFFRNS